MSVVIGMIHDEFMQARFVRALYILNRQRDISAISFVESGGGSLDRGRNLLVQKFLHNHTEEWLLQIDTDMYFGVEHFDRLMETAKDRDIVSGLYFANERPPRPAMYRWKEDGTADTIMDWEDHDILEVDGCGAGFLLVNRRVYEKMDKPAEYEGRAGSWFTQSGRGPNGQLLNEDSSFCERARAQGYTIYVDTDVFVGHIKPRILGHEI